jgi:hypothetical protein
MGVYITLFLLLTTNFQGKHTGPTLLDTSVEKGERFMSSDLSEKNTVFTIECVETGERFMSSDLSEKNPVSTIECVERDLPEPSGRKAQNRRGPPPTTKTHNTQAPRINRPKPPTHGLSPGQKDFLQFVVIPPSSFPTERYANFVRITPI